MNNKNCLTCRFEPEWFNSRGNTVGRCRCDVKMLKQPACCTKVIKKLITPHEDNTGIHHNCETWEPKKQHPGKTAILLLEKIYMHIKEFDSIPEDKELFGDICEFFEKQISEDLVIEYGLTWKENQKLNTRRLPAYPH